MIGITGFKCGMSSLFTEDQGMIPVTLIYVPYNYLTQIKTSDKEGYDAVQMSCAPAKEKSLTKAEVGHLKLSGVRSSNLKEYVGSTDKKVGSYYSVEDLKGIDFVDVQGVSKGKGFAGVIRRWGFKAQSASHGNSKAHRAHGSTGGCQDPGRVIKGKKMAGHLGFKKTTAQNLKLLQICMENNVLVVKGAVPGPKGSLVKIWPALKKGMRR